MPNQLDGGYNKLTNFLAFSPQYGWTLGTIITYLQHPGNLGNENIIEMNNGCICCTVRGDLIRILGGLMKRADQLDAIIVETTGLADPAPVA